MRILVAIELRSYGEAIGGAIQGLRPHLDVTILEPDELGAEVTRLDPGLVICSQPRSIAPDGSSPAWVEFRPYDQPAAKIHIDGQYSEIYEVELTDLLSVVDQAESSARVSVLHGCLDTKKGPKRRAAQLGEPVS